jgi:putative DNA primase/helicase
LYRLCENYHPAFFVDEAQDAFKNIDFCTILKAGHDPSDRAIRCDPQTLEPIAFDVFCPKVLAGIGRGPGQIMSRSVIIEMERRYGKVDSSLKADDPVFIEIKRMLVRWAADAGDLRRFHLPDDVASMRQRDNWEVFYRVASAIHNDVARDLVKKIIPLFVDEEQDFDTYLLSSLRKLFRKRNLLIKGGHLASEEILISLNNDKEAPWFKKEAKGITREKLASRLRQYKVKPIRVNGLRGYYYLDPDTPRNSLKRLFDDYLPPEKTP